jgi:hypothetical protein
VLQALLLLLLLWVHAAAVLLLQGLPVSLHNLA